MFTLDRPCPAIMQNKLQITIKIIIIFLEVYGLANIKSAKKRVLVAEIRATRNKAIKSKVKTVVKKVELAVTEGDKAIAQEALLVAISEVSKATSKGIFHKNTAARKVSRLTKLVNAMA